jgi:hypothetical protein
MMTRPWMAFAALTFLSSVAFGQSLVHAPAQSESAKSEATTGWANLPASARLRVSATIARDLPGYKASARNHGFHFDNPEQKLAADLGPQGVEVRCGSALWQFSLQEYGYGDTLKPLKEATPHPSSKGVEFDRGPLTEWYANGPMGMEQGFTIAKRPGKPNEQPLTLAMSSSSGLEMKNVDARNITLNQQGQPKLSYGAVSASDAAGNELKAWLEVRGKKLLLRVDDRNARYPVVIDPTITTARLTASDASEFATLGWNVAISGNTVAVGAPGVTIGSNSYQGAIYIFVKPASGWANMTQTAKLAASDGQTDSLLGRGVGISGNTVVAGAPGQFTNQIGEAYIFVEPEGGWKNMTETAILTPSDSAAGNQFGYSAGISGNTVVVGAFGANNEQGAAYVYVKPAGRWTNTTQTAILTASDGGDQFGSSVAISGKTIVSGSFLDNGSVGAAYVFVEPGGGWVNAAQTAKLTPSDNGADALGLSVAVSGNTVVAGAFGWPGNGSFEGAAYVFVEPEGGWTNMTQTAILTASDGALQNQLGYSIGISGKIVAVGAEGWPEGGNEGAVYVYKMPVGGWTNMTETMKLTVSDGASELGYGVAVSGANIVGGAPVYSGSAEDQGAAYVFTE